MLYQVEASCGCGCATPRPCIGPSNRGEGGGLRRLRNTRRTGTGPAWEVEARSASFANAWLDVTRRGCTPTGHDLGYLER